MKSRLFPLLFATLLLTSCVDPLDGQNQGGNTNINDDSGSGSGTGTSTGGQTTTGDVSKWPTEWQKYVLTYLNGKLPPYLVNNSNKFTNFYTGVVDGSQMPYFNPYISNTSPAINYVNDYGVMLRNYGWTYVTEEEDEDGDMIYYYKQGNLSCQYSKYKSYGVYYFDVYAFNDYYNDGALSNSVASLNPTNLGLKGSYGTVDKTINGYHVTGTDMMKQNEIIQIKKGTGKLTVEGSCKGIALLASRNADAMFVKYGPNKNSLKYAFNDGGIFNFKETANYIEVSSEGKAVLELETIDILN